MLSNRQAQLLDFIVREYVKTAEPVGSALVCEKGDFDVSPATIRNEMQALEEAGYLAQPYTSAGRVPTDKAYRLVVNNLLEAQQYDVDPRHKKKISEAIADAGSDPREMNRNAAQVLQELSDNLVIANLERSNDFYKIGLSSLMEFPEFREFERTFQLMSFFDQFDQMFGRLERELFSDHPLQNFNILIGHENSMRNIQDETMILVRHRLPGGNFGTLTIIGPTRMDYRKNIGLAQYTSEALEHQSRNDHE
jgi:transcriptional regulator of heat shock response